MERSHLYGVIKKRNNPNAPPTKIGFRFGLYSFGAEDGIRTRNVQLGKLTLYR